MKIFLVWLLLGTFLTPAFADENDKEEDREGADDCAEDLPAGFTPYNARHTGISWAIDKGVDLQKVRQRAGHGSLEVTSRYAAILVERDTSLADALEEIFDSRRPA